MERILIRDLKPGKKVEIAGFVEKIRDQKTMQFVVLRDRTGRVQVTVVKSERPEVAAAFAGITTESVVSVTGTAVAAPQVKLGGLEIIPDSVTVHSVAKVSPVDEKSSVDLLMDYRWLDLRDDKKRAFFNVMTVGEKAFRDWLVKNEFIEIHTPKLTAQASEGGAEVFEVKYYNKKAYLCQSPQFYKQMAMAAGFEKVFEVTPYYRAEKSYTSRHAAEAFCLDLEISYIKDHHDIMDIAEAMIKHTLLEIEKSGVMKSVGADFKAQTAKFPRVTLLESYDLLKKEKNYEVPKSAKGDLDPEGERLLCEIAREKYNSDFIYVTDYPAAARAFYSMKYENNPKLCKSMDLLYKGVEIFSGAQREHNPEKLRANMEAKGIKSADMEFYTQFFEYGCPPHGGIGLGLGRFFAKMLDLPALRDVTFLFRGPDRLAP